MQTGYMVYYSHLSKLAKIANKQTLFLAHMLYRMEWDSQINQMVVTLTAFDKRSIIKAIDSDASNSNRMANQYLNKLRAAGLIKFLGGGAYMVDPASYSGAKYIPKQLRERNARIYETRVFTAEGEGEVSAYIITEDGEKIDL